MALRMNRRTASALRIVSLAPSCTSILHAIGATRFLVSVTPWCTDIAPVGHLPAIGDCWRLKSIEQITRLRPTLIVGSVPFHPDTVAKILTVPAQFLALNPRSLADVEADIMTLGRIANRTSAGTALVAEMRRELEATRNASLRFKRKPRIYSEAWPNPRISSPPWVAELIELCGAKMVCLPGAKVSDESVAAARPDIILLAWAATGGRANPQKTMANPHWKTVPAIRNKQVFVVRDELLNTPAVPLVEGARDISRILKAYANAKDL